MVFVTGKGGVGKTTVAAALALEAAPRARTIVCELGRRPLARIFGRTLRRPRSSSRPAVHVSIDPDAALAEWMTSNIGRAGAALLAAPDAFRYFVAAAPALASSSGSARRGT